MKVTKQALKRGIVKVVSSGKVGTGFIVSGEGHILTCMHNLVGMDIGIMLPDAEGHFSTPVLPALPVTFRPSNKEDFAVLKVDDLPSHTHSLPLMGAGESVEHEGYSHGFPQVGDINGIGAQYKIIDPHQRSSFGYPMIQLGVANDITEGFSGAPILDLSLGKVVGMIRQIPFTDEDNRLQNAAFGIPLDFIAKVCEEKYKLVVERPGAVDWPIGVKPIKDSAPTRTTRKIRFDDYLYSNRLPYYSRDTFAAAQEGEDIGHALRESELLDRLLGTEEEASKLSGAIISGEGGVGKTRLMLELGRMASQREWEVLVVDSNLENLEVVKPYLKPKTKYLFIFDYLEEHSAFDAALEDTLAEPEREIEVKLLANCRITFKNKSEAYPEDRWIEEVKLDEQAPSELNYKSYVVQSILQSYIGEVPKRVLDLAKLRPAFAVFIRYLIDSEREKELELKDFQDFPRWFERRLRRTISPNHPKVKPTSQGAVSNGTFDEVAKLFSILPARESTRQALMKDQKNLYDRLIDDGWIDYNDDKTGLKAIHDLVTDSILLSYFKRAGHKRLNDSLLITLEHAVSRGEVKSWIRSMERIQTAEPLDKHPSFFNLFKQALPNKDVDNGIDCYAVVSSSLLSVREVLDLLQIKPEFFDAFISSKFSALPISYLTNEAAKIGDFTEHQVLFIQSMHLKFHAKIPGWELLYAQAARLISTYIRLFGLDHYIKEPTLSFLDKYGGGVMSSFVLARWVEKGGELDEVGIYLKGFLKRHHSAPESLYVYRALLIRDEKKWVASYNKYMLRFIKSHLDKQEAISLYKSYIEYFGITKDVKRYTVFFLSKKLDSPSAKFILKAWLNTEGEKSTVEPYVIQYLKSSAKLPEAQYVIKAWLDSSGDKATVQSYVSEYLEQNAEIPEAQFVLTAWLDSQGEKSVVRPYIVKYLEENAKSPEAQFVLNIWLGRGGDRAIIDPYVIQYLNENSSVTEASFVFQSWLEAKGETAKIEPFVSQYLQANAVLPEASFVYQAWLEAGGDKGKIEPFVFQFLEANAVLPEASFVCQAWLEAGGDKRAISSFVFTYLEANAKKLEASFVYQAWLKAKGDVDKIKSYIIEFLSSNAELPEASFVCQAWLESAGVVPEIEPFVHQYLEYNTTAIESSFVLQAWLNAGGSPQKVENLLIRFLEENANLLNASFVIQAWFDAGGKTKVIEPYVVRYLKANAISFEASYVFQGWLLAKGDLDTVKPYLIEYLTYNSKLPEARFAIKACLNKGGREEAIEQFALTYLRYNCESPEAQFILKSWLDAKAQPTKIKDFVVKYLEKNAERRRASFVFKAWLDKRGDHQTVQPYIIRYLKVHSERDYSSFVYQAWLDAGADIGLAKPYFLRFISKNASQPEAAYVLKSWLDAGGGHNELHPFISEYFNANAHLPSAQFVLTGWSNSGGECDFIEPYVAVHLQTNATNIDTSFLLKAWLDAGGKSHVIRPYLLRFLEYHTLYQPSQFVFRSCFKHLQDVEDIKPLFQRHLHEFYTNPRLGYAIQSWLKHSTEDEQIDAGILKYLSANASQKEAGLVLQSWIKRKVKLAKVYPYVTEHLKNQIGVKASGFLIQAWLDNGLDPEYIKVYVEKWLSIHASTANHYEYVLEKWEKAMGYR